MSRQSSDATQFILLLLVGGPMAIAWGMKKLKLKREIENTPTSKVRSAAMGRIELSGIARQRKALSAPLSKLNCCWWQCRVQELRKSGKSSRWVTIHTVGSVDFFYLDDLTGKVLVNPIGAELHVMNTTHDLNASTRTQISPILRTWGINDTSWFGFDKRLRILEECLPDCAPVYVLGELSLLNDHLKERQERFRNHLRQLKASKEAMKEADFDGDGQVTPEEWDAFRTQQEAAFLNDEQNKSATEEQIVVKAPLSGSYIIATGTEHDFRKMMGWFAPVSLALGLLAAGTGVFLANMMHWSPLFIVGLVAAGIVAGFVINLKGVYLWRFSSWS